MSPNTLRDGWRKRSGPLPTFDGMATANSNATDPTVPIENFVRRAMLALHSALRREFELLPVAVGRVTSGAQGRAVTVADHAEILLIVLDLHCRAEVEAVYPLLVDRCRDSFGSSKRQMSEHHDEIAKLRNDFKVALDSWRSRVTAGSRDDFIGAIARLTAALHEHLTDEWELIVPLMDEHITGGEFEAIMEARAVTVDPALQHLLLGMLMYEGDSQVVERVSATMAAAARQRAAADYFHHCQRVHGMGRPPVSTQLFGYVPEEGRYSFRI